MAWDQEGNQCPLAAVDRRLEDVHRFWHQAERAYFEPDAFRLAIQAAIQTARQVSFVLQKNKALIPDFEEWYKGWQSKLATIPLMRWMVKARNQIEKQGDLEAHSFVSAEIVASHLGEGPSVQVAANLSDAPLALLKSIPDSLLREHIKKDGVLRIRRRWIENSLPDTELLDAVAIAYGHLSILVRSAHEQIGGVSLSSTDSNTGQKFAAGDQEGRLPCMIGHEDARTLDIWLATGNPIELELIQKKLGQEEIMGDRPKLEKRYGGSPPPMTFDIGKIHEYTRSLFASVRRVFEKDGNHMMMAILFRNGKPLGVHELRPAEHGHKFIMMRTLAQQAQKLRADASVIISEAWGAPESPTNPYIRAVKSPYRKEFLTITAVSKNGDPIHLSAEILRDGKKFALSDTIEHVNSAPFAFAPLYEVWKKPIPDHWRDVSKGTDGVL